VKKVLIITYYWPPSGGAGVQRWLKFVKYLRNFNYEPVIYTPSNPENPVDDPSLLKDIPSGIRVLNTRIWEPYDLYKRFVRSKPGEKINTGFLTEHKKNEASQKISVWLRGNLFIPDARKFWIRPSVKFLIPFLSENNIAAIISTGPPHSMHLIAAALKKKFNIPWLADFRDPWTNIDYYKDLMLSAAADKKHHRLEKEVLATADAVVTIGETMKAEFEKIAGRKVEVITNGYDTDDIYEGELKPDLKFSLAHIGTLVKSRNPETLWMVLGELVKENNSFAHDLEIKLAGKVDVFVMDDIKKNGLDKYLNKIEYMDHDEVIRVQQQSQVLLLLLNNTPNAKGILTGKFFEYMAARRPVICIGPVDGDAAKIMQETNCGKTVNFDDHDELKKIIINYYEKYKTGSLKVESRQIEKYSRKELTQKLSVLLDQICK
jgi:glycosyltransferase involved in cell wall biosynthesis